MHKQMPPKSTVAVWWHSRRMPAHTTTTQKAAAAATSHLSPQLTAKNSFSKFCSFILLSTFFVLEPLSQRGNELSAAVARPALMAPNAYRSTAVFIPQMLTCAIPNESKMNGAQNAHLRWSCFAWHLCSDSDLESENTHGTVHMMPMQRERTFFHIPSSLNNLPLWYERYFAFQCT